MKLWIIKNEFNGRNSYSTNAKNKNDNINTFIDLQFKRENEPEANCEILVKDAFFSCYNSKDGIKPKLIVMEYEVLRLSEYDTKPKTQEKQEDPFKEFGDTVEVDDTFLD